MKTTHASSSVPVSSSRQRTEALIAADRRSLWHPFTQTSEWLSYEPLVIEKAEGFHLIDSDGNRYVDGVSSIWCNVHGHGHPKIVAAMKKQLDLVAHSTMLGLTHAPGIELAERLVEITPQGLTRVFYTDSGSTAVEVALRMAFQYWRQVGQPQRNRFVSLTDGYHGDTLGSVSVGFSEPFHSGYESITFRSMQVDPPFLCEPIAGKAECNDANLDKAAGAALELLRRALDSAGDTVAAVIIEPLVQGAAGIWPQPPSYVRAFRELCDRHGTLLICDEVATGFGRTGTMFAVDQAEICPDIMCLAKGLSAGYVPIAATLATEQIFDAFSGPYSEYKTLFHGHTYGGNPLGCATALANLEVIEEEDTVEASVGNAETLRELLAEHIAPLDHVGPVRQVGMMVGFDMLADPATGARFPIEERRAHRAVLEARSRGVIVRPLADTMVLMPALNMPTDLLRQIATVTAEAVSLATD